MNAPSVYSRSCPIAVLGTSVRPQARQIASRHRIHRRMVRQALADSARPPPRKRGTRPAPAIGPIQDVLDKLVGEPLTVWEIWTTVTDQHDSDTSSAAIRDYIRNRRLAGQWQETEMDEQRDPEFSRS